MEDLKHSLFEFPDDPSEVDWKKEAILFYSYMLSHEKKYEKIIRSVFFEFRKVYEKNSFLPPQKKSEMFTQLKLDLYNLKGNDYKFTRIISFIVLITSAINKLEQALNVTTSSEITIKSAMILDHQHKEYFIKHLEKLENLKEKSFNTATNEVIRIVRTESWRFVNETRLEEFVKKGYKYKTTYPVQDNRTAEDSWYYYDTKQIKPVSEPFSYTWEGQQRVFMTPPDRPNDRNILIPYILDKKV